MYYYNLVFFFFLWEKKVIYVVWVLATRKKNRKRIRCFDVYFSFSSCLDIINIHFAVLHRDNFKRKYKIIIDR